METSIEPTLAALLAATLSTAGLDPIIDVKKAAALLECSEGQIETLAQRGQLPGRKYGRGWIFVTAQLLHHVVGDCARNLRIPAADRLIAEASSISCVDSSEPGVTPPALPQKSTYQTSPRGRPRTRVPDFSDPE